LIYHDRTLFRVLFYQEIKYEFAEKKDKYPRTVYTLVIYPTVRFNIHVPTVLGDFPIDRHVQEAPENLNSSNICRNINDPRYFQLNPSLNNWYKRQNQEPDYVIDTYTELRPLEITTGVRQGSWRDRTTTIYRHQQFTTEINRNGEIRSAEDHPQVGHVHKYLINKRLKSRKRRKSSARWYIVKSFNPVLNPYLRTEILHFLSSFWVHLDSTKHLINV
jgi:hypothetical protein